MLSDPALHQTAVHESGHAVMAWLLGLRVHRMEFKAPELGGRTVVDNHTDRLHDAYVALAGVECERALGIQRNPATDIGPFGDYCALDNVLTDIGIEDEMSKEVKDILEERVAWVFERAEVRRAAAALADLMLASAPLGDDTVMALLERMLPREDNPPIWMPLPEGLR